jgi:hypothetical protein
LMDLQDQQQVLDEDLNNLSLQALSLARDRYDVPVVLGGQITFIENRWKALLFRHSEW